MGKTLMFDGVTQALLDFKISYQEPVRFQDTLWVKFSAVEKRESKSRTDMGIVTFHSVVSNQNDEQVAEARLVFMIAKEKAFV